MLYTEILISESFEGGDEGASSRGQSIGELVLLKVRMFVIFSGLEFVAVFVFELEGKVLLVKILLCLFLRAYFYGGVHLVLAHTVRINIL